MEIFFQWDHYPIGDVYDWDTHAQFYYHAHPPDRRGNDWADEHGHFHTFLRPRGFPVGVQRLPDANPDDNDAVSHIIAISMDAAGQAQRLFTTNRWVTGETWYPAADVKRMLENFRVTHDTPSGAVNVWITSMLELFGPTIEALLDARDATVCRAGVVTTCTMIMHSKSHRSPIFQSPKNVSHWILRSRD